MISAVSRLLPPALAADWRNPLIFSWPVSDKVLEPMVPAGLELDRWEGNAYVSLVGLRFERVRVFGLPSPQGAYDEINLRFYVRRDRTSSDSGAGVVFIRQLVPQRMTAWAARIMYREPFEAVRTGHRFSETGSANVPAPDYVAYHWRRGERQQRFWARAVCEPEGAQAGSVEDFLTNRYWGYNGNPKAGTRTYHLSRREWKLRKAAEWGLECDLNEEYGGCLGNELRAPPISVLIATDCRAEVGLPMVLSD